MRMITVKFVTFVVITSVSASNDTVSFVRSSIETLKSLGMIPIFLWFSGVSSSELYPWIEDTPISNLVVRNACFATALVRGVTKYCDPYFEEMVEQFYLRNIVFFVPSRPESDLSGLHEFITWSYHVPTLVMTSPGEQPPVAPMPCSLMWISGTTIDVPDDKCLYTGGRTKRPELSADTFHVQDKSLYPKNIDIAFSLHRYYSATRNDYTPHPEVVAYTKTLPVLNVTPIWNYEADIVMEPSAISMEMLKNFDIGAVYTCYGHGFFSSSVTSNTFHVISWSSLTVLVAGLIFVGAVISTSFWLTRNSCPHCSCRTSGLVLFMVASAVGRSPVPLKVTCFPYRALLLLWLFGTFMIGVYLQTQITSEYNVPAYLPTVDTVEDLEALTSKGMILPCVDVLNSASYLLLSSESTTETIENLRGIIFRNLKSSAPRNGECYQRARDRTHVYISPADFYARKASYIWGLRSGKEFLLTCCSASLARKGFRYIQHHQRLVLLLAEAGLTIYEERRQTWNHTRESLRAVTFPFSMQFQLFIYGCAGSCLVLLCELLFSKMK